MRVCQFRHQGRWGDPPAEGSRNAEPNQKQQWRMLQRYAKPDNRVVQVLARTKILQSSDSGLTTSDDLARLIRGNQ